MSRFILSFTVLFFFVVSVPSTTWAAWPGSCTYMYTNCTGGYTSGTSQGQLYLTPPDFLYYETAGTLAWPTSFLNSPPVTYYQTQPNCTIYLYYWDFNQWNYKYSISTGGKYFSGSPGTFGLPQEPPAVALPDGCPGDCTEERAAKAIECGGDDRIMNWDDQTCTGECKPDCSAQYNALLAACGGRKYIEYFDDTICEGECVSCSDIKAFCQANGFNISDPNVYQCSDNGQFYPYPDLPNMGYYEVTDIDVTERCGYDSGFDPNIPTDPGGGRPPEPEPNGDNTCPDLHTACVNSCAGAGGIKFWSCSEETDTHMCICNVNPDDIPDPTPDPTPPPDTPPDDGNDPPPGETPPGDTDPDGGNDNALLGDIVDNTRVIANNVNRVGDILQTELNSLNATSKDIKNSIGTTNTWLSQLEESLHDGLRDVKNGLGVGFDTLHTDLTGLEGKFGDIDTDFDTMHTDLTSLKTELDTGFDTTHDDLSGIETKLGEISGKLDANYNDGMLPSANEYDSSIDPATLPEEEDFTASINTFIANAPFIGAISSSEVRLSGIDSCLTFNVYGITKDVCLSDYDSTFNAMGSILVGLACLSAFFIVIGRG